MIKRVRDRCYQFLLVLPFLEHVFAHTVSQTVARGKVEQHFDHFALTWVDKLLIVVLGKRISSMISIY